MSIQGHGPSPHDGAAQTPDGKVVVISGASGGVGRGIAVACGEVGWTVWIAARRATQGRQVADEVTAAGGKGYFHECDIAQDGSVAGLVQKILEESARLDGVVHNATSGASPVVVRPADVGPEEFNEHISVGLRGMFLLARHTRAALSTTKGSFVSLTSEAAFEGKRNLVPYAVVKAAQNGVARVLAREWGPSGIRVNSVAPLASTPAMERAFANDAAMEERVMSRNPLGRLGDPVSDIGPVVRFLLSDDSRYVTGQTLMADGGSCPIT